MNKRQELMEKILALVLLAYATALWVGERLRDMLFEGAETETLEEQAEAQGLSHWGKWRCYSGAFVWLTGYWSLPAAVYGRVSGTQWRLLSPLSCLMSQLISELLNLLTSSHSFLILHKKIKMGTISLLKL